MEKITMKRIIEIWRKLFRRERVFTVWWGYIAIVGKGWELRTGSTRYLARTPEEAKRLHMTLNEFHNVTQVTWMG